LATVPTLSPGTGLSEAGGHGGPLYESTELLSRSDWTPAARGGARVKLHKIRCRSKKYLTAEIAEYAEIIYFFFFAISAISAVNSYVSFLIRLAAFQTSDSAYMCQAYFIYQILVRLYQTKCEQYHIIQSEIPNPKDDYSHQTHRVGDGILPSRHRKYGDKS